MTVTASVTVNDGKLVTGALSGVYDRNGYEIKISCLDGVTDGAINLALVPMSLKTDDFRVDFQKLTVKLMKRLGRLENRPPGDLTTIK